MHLMSAKKPNYAFIDSQNLNLGISGLGWKLNHARFRKYLRDSHNVQKAFIFIGFVEENSELYDSLKEAGFELVFKPTIQYKDASTKGNVDAELVPHTMIEQDNYAKAVIVSGDGDFYCLVDYLISKGKLAKLLIPNKNLYSALLKRVDSKYLI